VNEKNIGPVPNFNKCLSLAKGDYIKFLCSDDKFEPELLEKYVSIMNEHSNVWLVGCSIHTFGLISQEMKPPFSGLLSGRKVIHEILNNYNYLGHPSNIMIRKEALRVGNFKDKYIWLADWELWLRMLSIGDCYIFPEPLAYTRFHEGQLHKTIRDFSEYFETYEMVKTLKNENNLNLDFTEINIDQIIKKRAIDCSLALPWTLIGIHKKENRKLFKKAFNVIYSEGVLINSFFLLSKKLARKAYALLPNLLSYIL
jgi:glycosyltransferase involved in cell wall biosynthesis